MDAGIHLGCQLGNAPPIFFSVLPKRKRAVHGPKEKNAFGRNFAPLVQSCCTGGGVRWCLRVCEGFPTGAAGRGTGLMADSRGAGADKNRGARTHLNCSSFRAFRFATRCPGGRRGLCFRADVGIGSYAGVGAPARADTQVGPYAQGLRYLRRGGCPHPPVAPVPARDGQRQRKEEQRQCDDHPDEGAPSATGRQSQKSQKTQACPKGRQNRSTHRYADPRRAEGHCTGARPSGLFFWTVHGPFSFPQDGKENGGCIPLDKPPAGAETPVAAVRRPISCYPRWSVRPSR